MPVAISLASWHCGVMVKLLCSVACIWIWRLVVQIPSWAICLPWMSFHYTLQLHGILQDFLLPRDGSHLSAGPKYSECQIFYFLTFSAEPWKLLERTLIGTYYYSDKSKHKHATNLAERKGGCIRTCNLKSFIVRLNQMPFLIRDA